MRNIDSLKNTLEFKEVYGKGISVADRLLVLYCLKNDDERSRLGISVSKKVGNSVVRHRLMRLIRESYLSLKSLLPAGYSIVVIARVQAADKSFSDILSAMQHLLRKQGIL